MSTDAAEGDNQNEGEKTADEDENEKPKQRIPSMVKVKKLPKYLRKITDEDLMRFPKPLPPVVEETPIEVLPKEKRVPAQERTLKEISSINERIASLVQVRQMGLQTPENKKELKQLMKDRKEKTVELKKLQIKQRSANKYRAMKKKIVRCDEIDLFLPNRNVSFRLNVYSKRNRNCILN